MRNGKKVKKLGSLLGDAEDVRRRKGLATNALINMLQTYLRPHKISETKRIRLYNALVLPILTYNSSTWALTSTEEKSLDAFHRKQLRQVLGIKYPDIITNHDLYERTNSIPLSQTIARLRFNLFGHVLRRDPNIPANLALEGFMKEGNRHRGRTKINIQSVLSQDIRKLEIGPTPIYPTPPATQDHSYCLSAPEIINGPLSLDLADDLNNIRSIAQDRTTWRCLGEKLRARGKPSGC